MVKPIRERAYPSEVALSDQVIIDLAADPNGGLQSYPDAREVINRFRQFLQSDDSRGYVVQSS